MYDACYDPGYLSLLSSWCMCSDVTHQGCHVGTRGSGAAAISCIGFSRKMLPGLDAGIDIMLLSAAAREPPDGRYRHHALSLRATKKRKKAPSFEVPMIVIARKPRKGHRQEVSSNP
jgi:hypothetical protein